MRASFQQRWVSKYLTKFMYFFLAYLSYHFAMQVAPFGGVKQSGLGREGSKYGMDEYVEVSILYLRCSIFFYFISFLKD